MASCYEVTSDVFVLWNVQSFSLDFSGGRSQTKHGMCRQAQFDHLSYVCPLWISHIPLKSSKPNTLSVSYPEYVLDWWHIYISINMYFFLPSKTLQVFHSILLRWNSPHPGNVYRYETYNLEDVSPDSQMAIFGTRWAPTSCKWVYNSYK